MRTFYRITSIPSTNPSPIYQEDKTKLNKLCLKSYVEAYQDIKPHTTFICDFCPQDYKEMIEKIVPFEKDILFTTDGINETCLRQYRMAREQDDDILFQECDYIYVPNSGKDLVNGLQELELVSPYDHLNFYIDRTLHSPNVIIKLIENYHWRSTERDTMTFAIKNKVFKDHFETFYKYGYLDADVWYKMLEKGHPLWVPIPSFATHMVRDWMAPSQNWKQIWNNLINHQSTV